MILSSKNKSKPPICVLTGFLGAGKTTLLNKILTNDNPMRIGVIVNDFGSVNIDAEILESVKDDTVSLKNGCICCTMRDDLIGSVMKLTERPNPVEMVLIEASGVADPSMIEYTLKKQNICVESVITVVDASEFLGLDEKVLPLVRVQIATADFIVLNKTDLVDKETLKRVDKEVRTLAPKARLIHTSHGEIPFEMITGDFLNSHICSCTHIKSTNIGQNEEADCSQKANKHHEKGHVHHDHEHHHDHCCGCHDCTTEKEAPPLTDIFESAAITIEPPLCLKEIRKVLKKLPMEIYRLKGLFYVSENSENQLLIQVAGERISAREFKPWGDKKKRSEIVAIGLRGAVTTKKLEELFLDCVAKQKDSPIMRLGEKVMFWRRNSQHQDVS
jgi:G3E family GTPase